MSIVTPIMVQAIMRAMGVSSPEELTDRMLAPFGLTRDQIAQEIADVRARWIALTDHQAMIAARLSRIEAALGIPTDEGNSDGNERQHRLAFGNGSDDGTGGGNADHGSGAGSGARSDA